MFPSTFTPYEAQEIAYRREELQRSWGRRSTRTRTRRRVVRTGTPGSARVALAC